MKPYKIGQIVRFKTRKQLDELNISWSEYTDIVTILDAYHALGKYVTVNNVVKRNGKLYYYISGITVTGFLRKCFLDE